MSRQERNFFAKKKNVLDEKEVFQKIRNLPTLPFVVGKAMEVLNNPRSSAEDLAKIVGTEQTLAAKTLKLVNSAYYGFPTPITTITHAVTILGFNTLRTLILGVSVSDFMNKGAGGPFNRKELWLHSVGTAVSAKVFAKKTNYPNTEEAFLAGLLHDLGKIILEQYFRQEFIKALQTSIQKSIPLFEAEKEIFGADHAEVGQYLGQQWKLPDVLTEAVRWHHEPDKAKEYQKISAIVHTANYMAHVLGIGKSGSDNAPVLNPAASALLNLQQINAQELSQEIQTGLKACQAFLELSSEAPPPPASATAS